MTAVWRVATVVRRAPGTRGTIAAVLRREGDDSPHVIVRRLRHGDDAPPAYRALLLALWEARRLGARRLILGTDDAEVAAQIRGRAEPPVALGPYLQVRALLNAFLSVDLEWLAPAADPDTATAWAAAAGEVHPREQRYTDLPLWVAAAS